MSNLRMIGKACNHQLLECLLQFQIHNLGLYTVAGEEVPSRQDFLITRAIDLNSLLTKGNIDKT